MARIQLMLYTQSFLTMCMEVSGTKLKNLPAVLLLRMTVQMEIASPSSAVHISVLYKTATTSKSSAIVAYPIHVVLLYFTPKFRLGLIYNEYKIPGLLSECSTTDEHDEPGERTEEHQFEKDWSVVLLSGAMLALMKKNAKLLDLQGIHDALQQIL